MHAPGRREMAADRGPYRAQVCHRPRNNLPMAASSAQDRNLPASARKLEKARADGQVVRSRDLSHFAAIAGGGAVLVAVAPSAAGWLKDALARSLRFDGAHALRTDAMSTAITGWTQALLWAVVPFGVALAAFAVL